mgnify:FL=1
MSTFERGILAFLFGWIVTFTTLSCITIKDPKEVRTFGGFLVTGIEGGSQSTPSGGVLSDVTSLLGNLSWFLVVGAIIFCLVLWKLPWLFRTIKARRAARAAEPSPSRRRT